MLQEVALTCPYCGERLELLVDASAGDARLVEDCQVCCRPIELSVTLDDAGDVSVVATTDAE